MRTKTYKGMARIDNIANHALVSEKAIERYLVEEVARRGGICLKYDNPHAVGFPDRLVILPGHPLAWVEVKSRGKKPRRIQQLRIELLNALGQTTHVADSREAVDNIIKCIERNEP